MEISVCRSETGISLSRLSCLASFILILNLEMRLDFNFSETDVDRIIQMAWEDRTSFDTIRQQFGLTPGQVIALMRRELKPSSFKLWRTRTSGRKTKHTALRGFEVGRFRCPDQKTGWKADLPCLATRTIFRWHIPWRPFLQLIPFFPKNIPSAVVQQSLGIKIPRFDHHFLTSNPFAN